MLVLQACLIVTQAAIVEVDLVFPRNDTYAPGPLMPVVFAIQNPNLATPFFTIFWQIAGVDARGEPFQGRYLELADTNITGPDPIFRADYAWDLNGTETTWMLRWYLMRRTLSCYNGPEVNSSRHELQSVWFSTKPGAPSPNLVQGPGTCASSGIAYNVTDIILHAPEPSDASILDGVCLVLSPPESGYVPAKPCGVTVNETTAAAILGDRCGPETATTCLAVSSAPPQRTRILASLLFPMLASLVLYVAL